MKYLCVFTFLFTFCLTGCGSKAVKETDLFGNLLRLKTTGVPANIDSTFNSLGYKWAEDQDMEDDSGIIYANQDSMRNDYYTIDDQVSMISYTTKDPAAYTQMIKGARSKGFKESISGKDSVSVFTIYTRDSLKAVFIKNPTGKKASFTVILGKN